jgi:hypothetical protein
MGRMSFKRTASMLAAAAAVAGGLLVAAPAQAAGTVGSCWSVDNYTAGTLGDCWHLSNTFSESGVSIWNDYGNPTTALGTGAAGQVFYATSFSPTSGYVCDNGVRANGWYQGTDQATGVSGWVPDCYLNQGPTG